MANLIAILIVAFMAIAIIVVRLAFIALAIWGVCWMLEHWFGMNIPFIS